MKDKKRTLKAVKEKKYLLYTREPPIKLAEFSAETWQDRSG